MIRVVLLIVLVALQLSQACDVTLTGPSGHFTSPGYPAKYPNDKTCRTTITAPKGKRIVLKFLTFELEKDSGCYYDSVEIIEGDYQKKYCGNVLPPTYISKTNSIVVNFKSDIYVTEKGFNASFTVIDPPPPLPPATVNGPTCGITKVVQSRVIAGTNATRGAWPWQVGLETKYKTFFCGGSLIAANWVVTAAHCLDNFKASYLRVKVGDLDREVDEGTEQLLEVEKIIMHERYHVNKDCKYTQLNNDVGLIKLAKPVMLNDHVNTICLPAQSRSAPVGHSCYITGWGKIKHPGDSHRHLQQAHLHVVNSTACQDRVTRNIRGSIKITDQMICAGKAGTKAGGCQGDSGGPLACMDTSTKRYVLHGDVSWGSGNCDVDVTYSVFGRMSEFRSWIDQKLKEN